MSDRNTRITLDPNNPLDLIPATLATDPASVAVIPVFAPADAANTLVLSAKTRTRRLPPDLAAHMAKTAREAMGGNGSSSEAFEPPTHLEVGRVLLTVPADVARNLAGPAAGRHPTFIFMVRREMYDAAVRQAESGIVLADRLPTGLPVPGIVKP